MIRHHAPQKWFDMYPLEDIKVPSWLKTDMEDVLKGGIPLTDVPQMPTIDGAIKNNEWRPILQAYLARVSFMEHCIGIALEAHRASAHVDNTYIILFSDNRYHLEEKA